MRIPKFIKIVSIITVVILFYSCLGLFTTKTSAEVFATSTSTLTPTTTSTSTAMFTPTTTSTNTPTITMTHTITMTPTITNTPTITLTPTITNTSTPTLAAENSECIPPNERVTAYVNRVIDGDTIEVFIDGEVFKVRYIGINAAEEDTYQSALATNMNRNLVEGRNVVLIKDQSETDQYDRLLRYVLVGNIFVNYELVSKGYVKAVRYEPDVSCAFEFSKAQTNAVTEDLGIWKSTPTPAPYSPPTNPDPECDPNYPDVCIPPYPPDLNCPDIPYKNFSVPGYDPHGFDRDGNGLGCEG